MRSLCLLFMLFLSWSLSAQDPVDPASEARPSAIDGKTITFTEFIEYLETESGSVILTDVKIKYKLDPDKTRGMDQWWEHGGHPVKIKARYVGLHNCEFDDEYWLVLRDIDFQGYLAIVNCKNLKVVVRDSRFRRPVRFSSSDIQFMQFVKCQFDLGLKIDRSSISDQVSLDSCKFHIDSTQYYTDSRGREDFDRGDYMLQVRNTKDPVKLHITNSSFTTNIKKQVNDLNVRLNESKFSGLSLYNCKFGTNVSLEDSSVENQFTTNLCTFDKGILIGGLNINQSNSVVDWESIKNYKLSITNFKQDTIFNGLNPHLFRGEEHYADLISCYSNIYYTFKTQGNRFFANKAYIEW